MKLNEEEEFVFLHIHFTFANLEHLLYQMEIINAIYVKLDHSNYRE